MQRVVKRLLHILRLLPLRWWRRRSKHPGRVVLDLIQNTEGAKAAFWGLVLTNREVMRAMGRFIQHFAVQLHAMAEDGLTLGAVARSSAALISLAAHSIHKAKVCTAKVVWDSAVVPLRAEIERIKLCHAELKQQFTTARAGYLKELSMLRYEVRKRGDAIAVESQLEHNSPDITFFYDPMDSLSEQERKFALRVVSEKLKMILAANPALMQLRGCGQIAKMEALFVNVQVEQLEATLCQRDNEIVELKTALQRVRMDALAKDKLQEEIHELRGTLAASEDTRTELEHKVQGLTSKLKEAERLRWEAVTMHAELVKSMATSQRDTCSTEDALSAQAVSFGQVDEHHPARGTAFPAAVPVIGNAPPNLSKASRACGPKELATLKRLVPSLQPTVGLNGWKVDNADERSEAPAGDEDTEENVHLRIGAITAASGERTPVSERVRPRSAPNHTTQGNHESSGLREALQRLCNARRVPVGHGLITPRASHKVARRPLPHGPLSTQLPTGPSPLASCGIQKPPLPMVVPRQVVFGNPAT